MTLQQKTLKPMVSRLKDTAFVLYALWLRRKLGNWIAGELSVADKAFYIRRLDHRDNSIIDKFFRSEVGEEDLQFAGLKTKKFNFRHSCLVYFGIFDENKPAALGLFRVLGRRKVERTILVGKSWRRRGLRTCWHNRNDVICKNHKLRSITKINENNSVMLEAYKKKGYPLDYKEGHLYIFEETYD